MAARTAGATTKRRRTKAAAPPRRRTATTTKAKARTKQRTGRGVSFNPGRLRKATGSAALDDLFQQLIVGALRGTQPRRGAGDILGAYKTQPWLRAPVDKVGRTVASVEWFASVVRTERVRGRQRRIRHRPFELMGSVHHRDLERKALRKQARLELLPDHPILDFLSKGNVRMHGMNVRRVTQNHIDLVGEGFWALQRSPMGMPIAPWVVAPQNVEKLPTPDEPFYELATDMTGSKEWAPQDVLHFCEPDPEKPYGRGSGIASTLADELAIDENAAKYLGAFFRNFALPPAIVTGAELDNTEIKRLERLFKNKVQGAAKMFESLFTNRELKVERLDTELQSMQMTDLRRSQRDTLIHVYGVPPEIFGILTASNRATIEAADFLYQATVIEPRLELIRAVLQAFLAPQYDARLVIDFVSPIREDKEHRLNVMKAQPGAFQVDDWRDAADLEPLEDDKGKVYIVSGANFTVRDLDELSLEASREADRAAAEAMPDVDDEDDEEPRAAAAAAAAAEEETEDDLPSNVRKVTFPRRPRPLGMRRKISRDEVTRIVDAADANVLNESMAAVRLETVTAFGDEIMSAVEASFDVGNPRVVRFLGSESASLVKKANRHTKGLLRRALAEGTAAGEGDAQLASRLAGVFDESRGPRTLRIARTETTRASGFGSVEGIKQAGLGFKEWLAQRGGSPVRDVHQSPLDGQIVEVDKPFRAIDGATAHYPGGFGIASHDINCRCIALAARDRKHSLLVGGERRRAAVWKQIETRRTMFDRAFARAIRRGFTRQQEAVLAEFRRVTRRRAS